MNTTIETSRSASTYSTQKPRLTFKEQPAELTGGAYANLESTVTLTQAASQPAPASPAPSQPDDVLRYRDLSAEERKEAKDTLKQLSSQARLWVPEGNGLRRAEPAEIKERLDHGQPIELISRLGSEVETHGSSSSDSYYHQRGFFAHGVNSSNAASSSSEQVRVNYTHSPVTSWDSLDFVDTDQTGVPGTGRLPASGGQVTISSDFESNWSRSHDEEWGLFTQKNLHSDASSSTRIHSQA